MIEYRPFRNSDPPLLADLWRQQPALRGLVPHVTPLVLERLLFSKPYFDPQGLVVAADPDRVVGFVHAGFGPDESRQRLDTRRGAVCLLMVAPDVPESEVAQQLLARAEQYLEDRGAETIWGGAAPPDTPFYLGLYGGSNLPGVLADHLQLHAALQRAGYQPSRRVNVLQSSLATFRPVVDRQQMQLRRQLEIATTYDPLPDNWWDHCTIGPLNRLRVDALPRGGGQRLASVTLWDMEPLASSWGRHAIGILACQSHVPAPPEAIDVFLLGESLRQLAKQGVALAEVQLPDDHAQLASQYARLGFQPVDHGIVYRRP